MKTTINIITISSIILCLSSSCIGLNQIHPEEYKGYPISEAVSLSDNGTANSYIVSKSGIYTFLAVKGNSSESVGSVESAEVLWESFGTDLAPSKGDLIQGVIYEDGNIYFKTADTYREGNAVVAAKDASGTILWSWHIWLTDHPQEQVYYNNAGTMMDRNLGATSADPGSVSALGLLYQWGRKDPFLGSSSITVNQLAYSTMIWPRPVLSDSSVGTIEYATLHPTEFITHNNNNYDWHYTGSYEGDTRWTTSDARKSIYDPCPAGWRVPDGGHRSIWKISNIASDNIVTTDSGFSFKCSNQLSSWYPSAGSRSSKDGSPTLVGRNGYYWTASSSGNYAYALNFGYDGNVNAMYSGYRAFAFSVRCMKEVTQVVSLSDIGTANSYIVSEPGVYSFLAVKGNSSESVGDLASAEVLWESFGTSETPSAGSLIASVSVGSGSIVFEVAEPYREGNAVIAAKDASGTILWSWHIWSTDQPQEQVYYNNAGTMMDRNLGATSATPGDVGALGLLYQWGRKDPFLGSSSIRSNTMAKSTLSWPSAVSSSSSTGTIGYATEHPTTFIKYNGYNYDWHYSADITRWQSDKTIYDPCPVGWRVPDGGDNGVWSNALASSSSFYGTYDKTNEGMNFSGKFGSASTIWYPASGWRYNDDGVLGNTGYGGYYWSVTLGGYNAYSLYFFYNTDVNPTNYYYRARGFSVRCLQVID